MPSEDSSTFLTTKALAERWGMNPVSIERLRKNGNGPKFIKITRGPRGAVRYRLTDILEYERYQEPQESDDGAI